MDWSQFLYTAALLLAIRSGRPAPVVTAAMFMDLAGTMLLHHEPGQVAIIDLVAIVMLAGNGTRSNVIAALFIVMQPIYMLHSFGLSNTAIYTIVDLIAYAQLIVLGGWDVGMRRRARNLSRRYHSHSLAASIRSSAEYNRDVASWLEE
jgi:hypothetical protein